MERLIENLVQHISAALPELAYVSEDCGQLEMLAEMQRTDYPFAFPAVLADCERVEWSNVQGLYQKGEARFRICLLADCYDEIAGGTHSAYFCRVRGALQRRLHEALQGFCVADGAQDLVRYESQTQTFKHGIKVYETSYTAMINGYLPETGLFTQVEKVQIVLPRTS